MKSSPPIWHLLHNVKSTVKISSLFVAFLENMNFNRNATADGSRYAFYTVLVSYLDLSCIKDKDLPILGAGALCFYELLTTCFDEKQKIQYIPVLI